MHDTFYKHGSLGHNRVVLAFSPLFEETGHDVETNGEFIICMLSVIKKSLSNVVALVDDNCSTNR